MKKDTQEYVKKCDKCQRFGNIIHSPADDLTALVARPRLSSGELISLVEPLATISEPKLRTFFWRTSHRTATGETPFMLAFGIEATIPIEIRLPSQRRLEPDDEGRTTEHLDLLEKVRDRAALKMTSYQDKTTKYFNKKVRARRFRAGDLVLRGTQATGPAPGKLGPVWEGPFEIIRQL
ncbi:uncharacterized protein LOC111406403 [Olea europaea var. sylvestris]|uniref:uncharacterized protein LOC111406403 n=1 Tax=Olea europaea var. sylvestris TaxID=158386 RepID=UPI000C1D6289|nr:uncharacterized protein LOC111406403 [Olea europaea var. sylvestris]